MKKLIFVGFLSCFMAFGVALISHPSFEKTQTDLGIDINHVNWVYINDVFTPDMSPKYGKCFFVNADDVSVSGFISDITPTANSPPTKQGISGV